MSLAALVLGLTSALCVESVRGWSLLGEKRRVDPSRSTRSLIEHLRQGSSRVNDDVSVVTLSKHECGFRWSGKTPANVGGGRQDRSDEEREIAFVDRAEFVSPQCGRDTDVGRAVEAYFGANEGAQIEYSSVLPRMYIAIFLSLTRRGVVSGGAFAPYLLTLPSLSDLLHLPVFWNARELDELQDSVLKEAVQKRRSDWEEELSIIMRAIANDDDCQSEFVDCETWFWARSIITSRAFKDGTEPCLVPYVDMMNHINNDRDDTVECEWNIDPSGFHLVVPEKRLGVGMGKSVELSYGYHSNSNFLLNYGFSIPGADQVINDQALLSMILQAGTDAAKEALWEADGLGDCYEIRRNVTVSIGDPGPMQSLLSLCRVASSRGPELGQMQEIFVREGATTTLTDDGLVPQLGATLCRTPFSVPNEIRAMEMLQQITSDGLLRYGTTLAADDRLLRKGLSWRQRRFGHKQYLSRIRNAVTVRRGEKQVIHHFYNIASLALDFLKSQDDADLNQYKGMLEASLTHNEPIGHVAS